MLAGVGGLPTARKDADTQPYGGNERRDQAG